MSRVPNSRAAGRGFNPLLVLCNGPKVVPGKSLL